VFKNLFLRKKDQSSTKSSGVNADGIITKAFIEDTLASYRSDIFVEGILSLCLSHHILIVTKKVQIDLVMPFPCIGELTILADALSESLTIQVSINVELAIKPVRQHQLANVVNVIAIASGKGGVGKSTTAVNLAFALMAEGAKVGILDADIYGPSIPRLLGVKSAKPSSSDGKLLTPINAQGLHAMSIGFLVPEDDATVWRGPMASSAFSQLLNETAWPSLDYLIIDMPPGTGDIQLTLAQKVPVAAAVIITTPQDIALADAVKGIAMFDKVKVPVLGVIENMSYHCCEKCGHQSAVFGQGGGQTITAQYQTPLLGQLPLDITIRQDADNGKSGLLENSAGDLPQLYRKIARTMAAELFNQLDLRSSQTPEIIKVN
jgi:ATP-binding protein involved in chromosome partitioning